MYGQAAKNVVNNLCTVSSDTGSYTGAAETYAASVLSIPASADKDRL